jgi:hypothetical protein
LPPELAGGDRVFIWASAPDLCVVGLARSGGQTDTKTREGEPEYLLEYLTYYLDRPIGIERIRSYKRLADASFVKRNVRQGILKLSPAQGALLFRIILSDNPNVSGVWRDLPRGPTRGGPGRGDVDAGELEGAPKIRTHQTRERNSKLARQKKASVFERTGKLVCEACKFDFTRQFGPLGRMVADVHHLEPLGDRKVQRITSLRELAILCPNCHRMFHRCDPLPTTITKFKRKFGMR